MKPFQWVPPLLVLIIAAAWLTNLHSTNRILEQQNTSLRSRIADSRATKSAGISDAKGRANARNAPPDKPDKPSADWISTSKDWTALVLFNNNEERFQYTAAWKRLETLASEMNGDELTVAYQEMGVLPVHAPFRNYLESMMLTELETKNPEFAFSQYIIRNQDGGVSLGGYGAFDKWLARDPAAATTWYERQIAAGTFDKSLDGKSPAVVPFESALIMSLIGTDPAAAEERIRKIPPELRSRLGPYMWGVSKENSRVFIDLLRKTMPMEEYVDILRKNSLTERNFSFEIGDDPTSAKKNLESLGITPEERSILLTQQFKEYAEYRAMRDEGNTPSRQKFDDYRTWIEAIDPAAADQVTGVALQSYLEKSNGSEALDFVEQIATDYLASGAGDELLIPLIEGSAKGSAFPKEKARALAKKITDADLRSEMLQKLN
jgi:hypothetical protein